VLRSKLGGTRLELRDPNTLDELAGVEDRGSDDLLGLSEALRELPSRQRRALVLRDWQGLSYNEIAAEMAVSDAAVETLLFRARNKVATALVASDWRRRLAPASRALLFWPFGFLRMKTAATTGAEHLKLGLALAGGTVVPLVAFGLFQVLLGGPPQAAQGARQPAVPQLESAQPAGMWLAEGPLLHASQPGTGTSKTGVRTKANHRRHHASPNAAANVVRPPSTDASNSGTAHEAKIVLCHGTHSQERPAVTISVSKHALAGLGQDSPGACR
jgi:hypothetical protein